ncbi:hypothetical protein Micbo1qcDRAFT_207408 [Microdochium bolleyi]|uniref:Uncharacterized protein n=1 Tax=Microdochium bolleyi TaxID=196109 RepID=A0A136ITJ6_9PEZI|nr:hypothetical protein Micbo1qcDRAFT_207408 [Microdochium bolleyi]
MKDKGAVEHAKKQAKTIDDLLIGQKKFEDQYKTMRKQLITFQAAANVINAPAIGKPKFNAPAKFDGSPGKLRGFLTQLKAY